MLYYGIGFSYVDRVVILNFIVIMFDGVYYGFWKFLGMVRKGVIVILFFWIGFDFVLIIVLWDFDNSILKFNCKNFFLSWNGCGYYIVDIIV